MASPCWPSADAIDLSVLRLSWKRLHATLRVTKNAAGEAGAQDEKATHETRGGCEKAKEVQARNNSTPV